ncbi:hypothetical protein MUP01_12400 [Candidatus Bathyarchaeota archaeon]|nr:hypothetical protein [Candidatus Bathyarchaeota archaeon]
MLPEPRLKQYVIIWLNKEGYDVIGLPADTGPASLPSRRGAPLKSPNPPDIYAKRRGQNFYYYIEAKGDPPGTQALSSVLGEITRHMVATTPTRYAIAVPMSFCRIIGSYFRYEAWKRLGVYILLVDENAEVSELNPSKRNHEWICSLA